MKTSTFDIQQAFDKVVKHLLTQGMKSTDSITGYCQYRGDSGRSCAVGCLIDDLDYSPNLEGNTVMTLGEHYPAAKIMGVTVQDISVDDLNILGELQAIHDTVPCSDWRSTLEKMAKERNLNFNPPEMFNG
jgi:hypothetical protein